MKISDLKESIGNDLEQDLNDLLMIAKGNGLATVDTNRVVSQLKSMGYSVTPETLVQLIQQGQQVPDASLEKITLSSPGLDGDGDNMSPEETEDHVEQLAIKSGMKGVKQ